MTLATWADPTATWADPTATWAYAGVTDLDFACEWSPTTDPGDTPVWEDITQRVRSGRVTRGRQSEFDRTSAGTMTLVVDNRDRTFDPTVSAGARPNKRIRVTVGSGADLRPVFDGWIDALPQSYSGPGDATVTLTATDGFKMLARFELDPIYGGEVSGDSPWLWWRFIDDLPYTTTAADASGNDRVGTYKGTPTLGESLLAEAVGGTLQMDAEAPSSGESLSSDGVVALGTALTAAPLSIECWIRTAHYGTNSSFICGQTHVVSSSSFVIDYGFVINNNTGVPSFVAQVGGLNGAVSASSLDLRDTGPHHLVGTIDSSRVLRFYVDGAYIGSNSTGASSSSVLGNSVRVGKPPINFTGTGYAWGYRPYKGEACEFAVYSDELSAGEVTAHYTAGAAPWSGDTTGTRVGRILDLVGWPAGERLIETGASTLGAAVNIEGNTALAHLLAVEQTEQGRFFIDGAGVATFFSRNHETSLTTQAEFADGEPDGLEFDFSDANLCNDCVVTREGGVPQRAQDAASIAAYWRASAEISGVLYSTDNEARAMAQWRVLNYATPTMRPSALKFKPFLDLPDLYPRVLARELGDRIAVTKTALDGGTIEVDAVIEGISHEFVGGKHWVTSWNLSPRMFGQFGPGGGSGNTFWKLDHLTLGKLDSGNRLAF